MTTLGVLAIVFVSSFFGLATGYLLAIESLGSPIYNDECDLMEKNERRILYICDRRKCNNCSMECTHTTDIEHAVNFKNIDDYYMEESEV